MKVLKVLIILALILFPFGEILRFDVGNNVAFRPLDVVVGVMAVLFLSSRAKSRDLFKRAAWYIQFYMNVPWGEKIPRLLAVARNDMRVSIATFGVIGLISLLINLTWLEPKEFFVSASYLLRWVAYATFAGIIWQFDEKFKKKLLFFLFIDGLIILVAGFLQYFFYNSLKNLYHLGWDEHMHRMFSIFFDPNFAGAFFVLFFLFVGGMLSAGSSLKLAPKRFGAIYKIALARTPMKIFLFIILFLTLIAIFLSFSRGALLSLFAGSAVFFFLIKRAKLFLILIGVMALFVAAVSPQFYDENMNLFRTASSKARIGNYESALKIIQDRPLLGVGFNSYRYAKEEYGMQMGWVKTPSHADAGVDNSFLFVLATTGVVGLFAYLWMWFAVIKRAYAVHKKNVLGVVIIASSVALFVNALFINSLFFAPLMLWMWVLVGLMEGYSHQVFKSKVIK